MQGQYMIRPRVLRLENINHVLQSYSKNLERDLDKNKNTNIYNYNTWHHSKSRAFQDNLQDNGMVRS